MCGGHAFLLLLSIMDMLQCKGGLYRRVRAGTWGYVQVCAGMGGYGDEGMRIQCRWASMKHWSVAAHNQLQ
jgi:hypothetical protein